MAIVLTKNWQKVDEKYLGTHDGFAVYVRCYARHIGQSTENNTTTVQVESRFYNAGGTIYSGSGTYGYATVDGETETTSANRNYGSGETTVAFKQKTVEHNNDGTKSINVSARWSSQPWGWDKTASANVDLPKIDRYAYITDTVQNPNDESTIWFSYENPKELEMRPWLEVNPNGTHYATRTISDAGTSGTYTWELTTEERNQLRSELANANSGTLRIGVYSTIDNVQGYSYKDVPFSIVNANPTMTYTITETNTKVSALLGTSANTIVQNASIVNIVVSPTTLKEAGVEGVVINHGDTPYTITTSPYSFDIPITTNSFRITTVDTRANYVRETITKTLIEYQPVDITNLSMKRVNPTSSNIVLNLEATYYQKTFGSTANVPIVKWKLDNGNYTTIPSSAYTIDTTNNKLTITNYILTNVLDYRTPGQFTLYIEDLLTNDTEGGERGKVLKGIDVFDAGEHDFKVNGTLYVADQDGNNKVDVMNAFVEKCTPTTDANGWTVIDNPTMPYIEYYKSGTAGINRTAGISWGCDNLTTLPVGVVYTDDIYLSGSFQNWDGALILTMGVHSDNYIKVCSAWLFTGYGWSNNHEWSARLIKFR
jgi:hypothetical protein